MKNFFKSPSFKAIAVLLSVAIISAGLLSVLNDLLFVSQEERTNRALSKVYAPATSGTTAQTINTEFSGDQSSTTEASVVAVYTVDSDGVYIVQAKGTKGWKGQTEVMLAVDPKSKEIKNIVIVTFGGDDKTTTIKEKYLADSYVGQDITTVDFVMGNALEGQKDVSVGASSIFTMESIMAAVNKAGDYLLEEYFGGSDPTAISPAEQSQLESFYTSTKVFTKQILDETKSTDPVLGEVLAVYSADDGATIVRSKGGMFTFGGMEVLMLVKNNTVEKIQVTNWASAAGNAAWQIPQSTLDTNFVGKSLTDFDSIVDLPNLDSSYITSGATATSKSIMGAVKIACNYIKGGAAA